MSMIPEFGPDDGDWYCAKCGVRLEQRPVPVFYLNSAFDVVLPRCPSCGWTLVPKSLAQGKMHEVESLLEEK